MSEIAGNEKETTCGPGKARSCCPDIPVDRNIAIWVMIFITLILCTVILLADIAGRI